MKLIRNLIDARRGSATVEFSMTIGIFILVFFMIFELARLAFVSSYYDFMIAETVRVVKNTKAGNGDYASEFKKIITEQLKNNKSILTMFLFDVKENNIVVNVDYADSVDDLVKERFRRSSDGREAPIALYNVEYNYEFFARLPLIPTSWTNNLFNRKILVIQEYERSLFKY